MWARVRVWPGRALLLRSQRCRSCHRRRHRHVIRSVGTTGTRSAGPHSRPALAAHHPACLPACLPPTHPPTLQDNSTVGIRATLARLSQAVRNHDEQLWEHLEAAKLNPQFYAFR